MDVQLFEGLERKSRLGQFFTSPAIARFMASMFPAQSAGECRLLDAGAGVGSLTRAFLERWTSGELPFDHLTATAYEFDESLLSDLQANIKSAVNNDRMVAEVLSGDFVELAVNNLCWGGTSRFTHAILNPPYKKISSDSLHRKLLREAGIETVNLYSAFVALALALLEQNGVLVAIIPRSFCNGPYYLPFRKYILENSAVRHIHLFGSRTHAFKDDGVLQENVILMLEKGAEQSSVTLTYSTDSTFNDLQTRTCPFAEIVSPNNPHTFFRIPVTLNEGDRADACGTTLSDLGITVSTGPVVDFRMREYIHNNEGEDVTPLVYPRHFRNYNVCWPKPDSRKPDGIEVNATTSKSFYTTGYYVAVRRFSSKEEKQRIVASVVSPEVFPGKEFIAFENHLNVFHSNKHGLDKHLAWGLCAYLNSKTVDTHFRVFSGHTQVNSTDLRSMKYPSREKLIALGQWAEAQHTLTQETIEQQLGEMGQ